jgi:hypothetical protein
MRVKWSAEKRRWQFDWDGVSEEIARRHGYRGRAWAEPATAAPQFVVPPASILAAVEKAIAPAVRRLEEARKKRERAKRANYYAGWYSIIVRRSRKGES